MLSREAGEVYAFITIAALVIAIVSARKPVQNGSNEFRDKICLGSFGLFVVMFAADMVFGIRPPTPKPAPKVETVTEKPKPPKVQTPEQSFYAESYDALAAKTKLRVTDSWLLEYGERVTPDGNVDTHGFVEFSDDGIKRQFWLVFDGKTRECLRVKIDGDLIYSVVGW